MSGATDASDDNDDAGNYSFRLRYVAIGLLIYTQSAFSQTCSTDFDNVASSADLADSVLLATATRVVRDATTAAATGESQRCAVPGRARLQG